MCPACIATAAWAVTGATSAGAVTTLVVKKLRAKIDPKKIPPQSQSKEKPS